VWRAVIGDRYVLGSRHEGSVMHHSCQRPRDVLSMAFRQILPTVVDFWCQASGHGHRCRAGSMSDGCPHLTKGAGQASAGGTNEDGLRSMRSRRNCPPSPGGREARSWSLIRLLVRSDANSLTSGSG
jgi:hypothetical protein